MISRNLFCLLSSFLLSQTSFANNGRISADGYASQFVDLARMIQISLEKKADPAIDAKAFERAIRKTKIESTDQALVIDGKSQDAINYPAEKRIILSRQGWSSLVGYEQRILVLHEYLGILGVDDSNNKISERNFLNQFSGANACAADKARYVAKIADTFEKAGFPALCGHLGGDETMTLNGTYLLTRHGLSIDKEGNVSTMSTIAECNPVTGKYQEIMSTAGGTLISPVKDLPPGFCNIK